MENKFLIVIVLVTAMVQLELVQGLKLEGLTNNRSTKKPSIIVATTAPSAVSTYRVNASSGATCILIRTDGLLSFQYRDKYNEDREKSIFLPDDPELSGDCSDSDSENFSMTFKGFTLSMFFKKTPGGERWYTSAIDVTYSTSNQEFENIDRPGLQVKLSTPTKNTLLFPTPVGKSYGCDEQVITMYSLDENDKSGHLAKLYLRELRIQSFMYKAASTWGPTFQCSASGTYRDESAPVAVASTLAVAVLATISGYGAWRYFKVKKVQYGTME